MVTDQKGGAFSLLRTVCQLHRFPPDSGEPLRVKPTVLKFEICSFYPLSNALHSNTLFSYAGELYDLRCIGVIRGYGNRCYLGKY
jgi:hypothetical protein